MSANTPFADQAIQDLKVSNGYKTPYKLKWIDAWKLYNNERIEKRYVGTADTFVPMPFQVVQTKLANVFGNKPRVVYYANHPDQNQETKILTQIFNYTWDLNRMSQEIIPFGTSLFVTGNARLFAEWDPDLGWIRWRHVPIADCIDDPTASNPRQRKYGGYRYLTTYDDLENTKVYNSESGEWEPKYKNIQDIPKYTGDDSELDKEIKDALEGSLLDGDALSEQVEITKLFYVKGKYKGKVIEIANRMTVIYEDDTPYQRKAQSKAISVAQRDDEGECIEGPDGQPVMVKKKVEVPAIDPFIPDCFQRDYVDGALLYGMGEIEPIADEVELLNDTVNQVRDNITHLINNRGFVDPKFKDLIKTVKNVPNSLYAIPPGAIQWETKPDMTRAGLDEIQRIKEDIRTTTALDEVTMGLQMDHRTTATEINTQTNQAGQRFGITLQALENEGYQDMAEVTFKLVQLFVTDEKILKIAGRQGVEWLKYNPDDYWGDYQPVVQLDQNAKAQNQDEIKRIAAAAQFLINNPYVDQKELTKIIATRLFQFDEDEAEQILVKNMPDMDEMKAQGAQMTASGQVAAQQQPPDNAKTPSVQERIIETIDFVDLPEDAKHQVLAQLGINSQMDSPTQQKVNAQGMQIQNDQTAQELNHAINLHKAVTGHDLAQQQHNLQLAQAIANQQQQQEQPQEAAVNNG